MADQAHDTGTIRKVALHMTEDALRGDKPAYGGVIDWNAGNWASWIRIGDKQEGDLANLHEDDINVAVREESLDLDPPLSQNRVGEILFKNGIDTFGFTCYSADADVMSLSSTARTLGADSEEGKVIAYRSAVIEVYGLGMDYFPKVRVRCTGRPGGPKTLRRVTFEVKVFGGFGIPSGSRWFGWE